MGKGGAAPIQGEGRPAGRQGGAAWSPQEQDKDVELWGDM